MSCLAFGSSAEAADTFYASITEISIESAGVVMVSLTGGTVTGTWPACATIHRYALTFSSGAGNQMYALLLSAKLTGKQVVIYGLGSCTAWPDSETVRIAQIQQ